MPLTEGLVVRPRNAEPERDALADFGRCRFGEVDNRMCHDAESGSPTDNLEESDLAGLGRLVLTDRLRC